MNVEQHWTLGPLGPLGPSGGAPVDTGEVSANITRKGYTLGRTLGAGRFSQVLHGKHASGAEFAVKVIEQDEDVESLEALRVEVAVLKATDHPNIVRLHEVVRTPSSTYLVMELLRGGELFDTIVEKGCFTEPEAKRVLRQLLSAVAHCHALGIVHRDLKPENLLFSQTAEAEGQEGEAQLKIIDFGYAALLEPGQQLRGLSGAASQTRRLRLRRSRRPTPPPLPVQRQLLDRSSHLPTAALPKQAHPTTRHPRCSHGAMGIWRASSTGHRQTCGRWAWWPLYSSAASHPSTRRRRSSCCGS